jgi:alkylhydroperoxidase family enzyme
LSTIIKNKGYTNETLEWDAWLDVVDPDNCTAEQTEVLEMSHPKAKVSDYYLFLVHQPAILKQRSEAFNAIMYAPGGLARADRELSSLVVCIAHRSTPSASSNWPSATTPLRRCSRIRAAPEPTSARKPLRSFRYA